MHLEALFVYSSPGQDDGWTPQPSLPKGHQELATGCFSQALHLCMVPLLGVSSWRGHVLFLAAFFLETVSGALL